MLYMWCTVSVQSPTLQSCLFLGYVSVFLCTTVIDVFCLTNLKGQLALHLGKMKVTCFQILKAPSHFKRMWCTSCNMHQLKEPGYLKGSYNKNLYCI